MIYTDDYFRHKNVTFAVFGSGDIMFSQAREAEDEYESMLIFSNQNPPKEIGNVSSEHMGKTSDEIDDVKIVFKFTRPESITALIHSLSELQKQVFKLKTTV